jgi:hypothetical protein
MTKHERRDVINAIVASAIVFAVSAVLILSWRQ